MGHGHDTKRSVGERNGLEAELIPRIPLDSGTPEVHRHSSRWINSLASRMTSPIRYETQSSQFGDEQLSAKSEGRSSSEAADADAMLMKLPSGLPNGGFDKSSNDLGRMEAGSNGQLLLNEFLEFLSLKGLLFFENQTQLNAHTKRVQNTTLISTDFHKQHVDH